MGIAVMVGMGLLIALPWIVGDEGERPVDWTIALLFGALAGAWAWRAGRELRTRSADLHVSFGSDALTMPRSPSASSVIRVPYDSIRSVLVMGEGQRRRLLLEYGHGLAWLPQGAFDTPGAIDAVAAEVRRRIVTLPDGPERLARMARLTRASHEMLGRHSRATIALLVVLWGYFLFQVATDSVGDIWRLVRLGANSAVLVGDGQLFRLVSGNFLHGHWLHLLMNGFALFLLGALIERIVGPARLLAIYLAAGLGGAVASYLGGAPVSVGASGAVFGLLGALAWLQLRHGEHLPLGVRQTRRWWIFIIAINASLPLVIILLAEIWPGLPRIDWAAHAGGFFVGLVATWLVIPEEGPAGAPSWLVRSVALALVGLTAVGLVQAGLHYLGGSDADVRALAAQRLRTDAAEHAGASGSPAEDDPKRAYVLNEAAWYLVTDAATDPEDLELAHRGADLAFRLAPPGTYEIADTLATASYRVGDLDEAVRLERDVLEHADGTVYATQLARFLRARGPLARSVAGPSLAADSEGVYVVLPEAPEARAPQIIYAWVEVDGDLAGLLRLTLPVLPPGRHRLPDGALFSWPAGAEPIVAIDDPLAPEDAPEVPLHPDVRFWPAEAEVLAYP